MMTSAMGGGRLEVMRHFEAHSYAFLLGGAAFIFSAATVLAGRLPLFL